jgi:hypothetical protein
MGNAIEMYDFIKRTNLCYQLLQDELSRKIFCARLMLDFDQSPPNIEQLVGLSEQQRWLDGLIGSIPNFIYKMNQKPKKLILYGTNLTGRTIAALFMEKSGAGRFH